MNNNNNGKKKKMKRKVYYIIAWAHMFAHARARQTVIQLYIRIISQRMNVCVCVSVENMFSNNLLWCIWMHNHDIFCMLFSVSIEKFIYYNSEHIVFLLAIESKRKAVRAKEKEKERVKQKMRRQHTCSKLYESDEWKKSSSQQLKNHIFILYAKELNFCFGLRMHTVIHTSISTPRTFYHELMWISVRVHLWYRIMLHASYVINAYKVWMKCINNSSKFTWKSEPVRKEQRKNEHRKQKSVWAMSLICVQ